MRFGRSQSIADVSEHLDRIDALLLSEDGDPIDLTEEGMKPSQHNSSSSSSSRSSRSRRPPLSEEQRRLTSSSGGGGGDGGVSATPVSPPAPASPPPPLTSSSQQVRNNKGSAAMTAAVSNKQQSLPQGRFPQPSALNASSSSSNTALSQPPPSSTSTTIVGNSGGASTTSCVSASANVVVDASRAFTRSHASSARKASVMDELQGNHLDSVSPFCLSVCLFEFVTHLLYPLSIPIVIAVQGAGAARCKGLIPGEGVFVFQVMFTILCLLPTALTIAFSDSQPWAVVPAAIGATFAMFRLFVIGGKYGCFTADMYKAIVSNEFMVVKTILLVAWSSNVDPALVDGEVERAEEEAQVNLSECFFTLTPANDAAARGDNNNQGSNTRSPPPPLLATTPPQVVVQQQEEEVEVRWLARDYIRSLMRFGFVEPTAPTLLPTFSRCCAVVLSLFPLWKYLTEAADLRDARAIACFITILLETLVFGNIVFGFLGVGMLHHYRQWLIRIAHCSILRFSRNREVPADVLLGLEGVGAVPAQHAGNIAAWVAVSTVISCYAATLTRRVSFNCLASVFVCGGLGVLLLLQAWLSRLPDPKTMALVSFLYLVVSLSLLGTALLGYAANRADRRVLKALEEEKFALRWRRAFATPPANGGGGGGGGGSSGQQQSPETYSEMRHLQVASKEDVREYLETLDAAISVLQRRNETSPLKVMFVAASTELVTLLLSLAASGAVIIAGVLLQVESQLSA